RRAQSVGRELSRRSPGRAAARPQCRVGHAVSAYDAVLAEMNFGKLSVGVGKLEANGARGLAPATPDFGKGVFEAVDHIDAHTVFFAGDRIEDWLAAAFGHAGHDQARLSCGDVELEVDRGKDRIVDFFQRGREHVEDGRPGLCILAAEDTQQRCALRLRRALIDHHCRFALALVDRARPAEDPYEFQAIEPGRSVVTLLDLEAANGLAISMRWQSVELAGAAVGAVAVDELTPFDRPFGIRHARLLTERNPLRG